MLYLISIIQKWVYILHLQYHYQLILLKVLVVQLPYFLNKDEHVHLLHVNFVDNEHFNRLMMMVNISIKIWK